MTQVTSSVSTGAAVDSMAQTSIHVSTIDGASAAVEWSGERVVTAIRSEAAGGLGIGFNGGEMLLLAWVSLGKVKAVLC
jgi:hypothetical protein